MKLRMVLSGGQTGADRTGLECARELSLETGGWAPRGYRTENGPDPTLKDFHLNETASDDYPTRTKRNVNDSEATVWFGNVDSPGYWATKNAAKFYAKAFFENPTPAAFKLLADLYEVLNIAGNRASTNPEVVRLVKEAFEALKTQDIAVGFVPSLGD